MSLKTIAIMSPGDMGSGIGSVLGENGFDVITCLAGRSDYTRSMAAKSDMRDVGSLDALVSEADLVLSILDPAKAVLLAGEVAAAMKAVGNTPPYADCNATSPATAEELNGIVSGAGAKFIDVGIIGGSPIRGRPMPMFATSGPDVALMEPLDGKAVKIVNVGAAIGTGSAIKICNGAWNKGAFALYTTVMMAAEHYGFTDILRGRLPGSQAGTVEKMDQAINRLPSLSGRYIGEMEQVAETFAAIDLPDEFHKGAAELFSILNATPMATERREEIDANRTSLETLRQIVQSFEKRN